MNFLKTTMLNIVEKLQRSLCQADRMLACSAITQKPNASKVQVDVSENILTHIQLTNKACKVVMLEILWKYFARKSGLIVHKKSRSIL